MYIFNSYFVDVGRKCGLLPNENKILALIKNKLQTFIGTPTKYHDLFILGYRDGLAMSAARIDKIIEVLESAMPTYFEFTFRRNAKAQIAGFKLARKSKFGY